MVRPRSGASTEVQALRSTAFLDYAVVESNEGGWRIKRDIVRTAAEEA